MKIKLRIINNSISTAFQIIISTAVLFFLYKFLVSEIGVEELGIWSLILATSSIAQFTQFGFSNTLIKYVAKYLALGDRERISILIQTAVLTVAIVSLVIIISAYPFAEIILNWVMETSAIPKAMSILPYGLLSVWLLINSSIILGIIDGTQRIIFRNLILVISSIINLILCLIWVPQFGLLGVAYSRVVQLVFTLFSSWFISRKLLNVIPIVPYKWRKSAFKEMFNYSFNMQVSSIFQFFYEPTTKMLLTKFGGLSSTGIYEIASRLAIQVRSVIVQMNKVIVPTIAEVFEKDSKKIKKIFLKTVSIIKLLISFSYSLVIIWALSFSYFWLSEININFVSILVLLSLGWSFSSFISVPYNFNLGIGTLKWNTITHIVLAILNLLLGYLFGVLFGGLGVVIGWTLTLLLSDSIVLVEFNIRNKIYYKDLINNRDLLVFTFFIIAEIVTLVTADNFNFRILGSNYILPSILGSIVLVSAYSFIYPKYSYLINLLKK